MPTHTFSSIRAPSGYVQMCVRVCVYPCVLVSILTMTNPDLSSVSLSRLHSLSLRTPPPLPLSPPSLLSIWPLGVRQSREEGIGLKGWRRGEGRWERAESRVKAQVASILLVTQII